MRAELECSNRDLVPKKTDALDADRLIRSENPQRNTANGP